MKPAFVRTIVWLLIFMVGAVNGVGAQDEMPFPLAEPGPYAAGYTTVSYVDAARHDRKVDVRILYPAVGEAGSAWHKRDAEPDRSGAPYPLILTGVNDGTLVNWQLPSHGFVLAFIADSYPVTEYNHYLVDFPRDLVFALEQLAASPPESLAGLIDTDHTGVLGYSWDGYGALSVSGVRADPEYYLSNCASPALETMGYPAWWNNYACTLAQDWESFATDAGPTLTIGDDGLWQPITDERIRAVAPMGPEGALFFGPRGLAAADRPALIIAATADTDNVYMQEAAYIFDHLGAADKTLISFVGRDHMMVLSDESFSRMRHFVTAFFGYHLQGRQEYADLYSRTFVEQFEDLAWGVYTGE